MWRARWSQVGAAAGYDFAVCARPGSRPCSRVRRCSFIRATFSTAVSFTLALAPCGASTELMMALAARNGVTLPFADVAAAAAARECFASLDVSWGLPPIITLGSIVLGTCCSCIFAGRTLCALVFTAHRWHVSSCCTLSTIITCTHSSPSPTLPGLSKPLLRRHLSDAGPARFLRAGGCLLGTRGSRGRAPC